MTPEEKRRYNREYYQRNKDKWGVGSGHRRQSRTTASPIDGYDPNSAQNKFGQGTGRRTTGTSGTANTVSRNQAQAERDKRNRQISRGLADEAYNRYYYNNRFGTLGRYRNERLSYVNGGMMDKLNSKLVEKYKNRGKIDYHGRAVPLPQAGKDVLRKHYMDSVDPYRDANKMTTLQRIKRKTKNAAKSYASAWKTGAKSIKSGVTGAAKSYGSAWKTGANTISKSAQKAKKKAAKFIAKLFG